MCIFEIVSEDIRENIIVFFQNEILLKMKYSYFFERFKLWKILSYLTRILFFSYGYPLKWTFRQNFFDLT